MPYASIADLPAAVRSRYSERCQGVFVKAYNVAAEKGSPEESCMKVAHTAAGMCSAAGKASMPMPATEPAMRRHMATAHDMTDEMPMAEMQKKHAAMHAAGADHEHEKGMAPMKATVIDDDAFRLCAIPFGGPIPSPWWPRGVDLDGETFTTRSDIKAGWFAERVVDWHHGTDSTLRRTILGKAVDLGRFDGPADEPDEDGWWVTVWLDHGNRRLNLIKKLAEQGAQIYGSSEALPSMVRKAAHGEITVWPYLRQTLSTSPQNTHSVLRPLKAVLEGAVPTGAFWSDIAAALTDLGSDLRLTSVMGDDVAKAGRMLSAANFADLQSTLDEVEAALERLRSVVGRQPDYQAGRDPVSTDV